MGLYIGLDMLEETKDSASYKFYLDEADFGTIEINKLTGEVVELKPLLIDEKKIFFERAAMALMKHWEKNEFPEKTCWA